MLSSDQQYVWTSFTCIKEISIIEKLFRSVSVRAAFKVLDCSEKRLCLEQPLLTDKTKLICTN
jgi:hypothetical protein